MIGVRVFGRLIGEDMQDLLCAELGRLLLNEVTACADDSARRDDCLALLSTSTRGTVPFIQ